MIRTIPLLFYFISGIAVLCADGAETFDHSHQQLDVLLKKHVSDGWVNYKGLKADVSALGDYIEGSAKVTKGEYKGWTKEQQEAFLFNLYNAATLKLIVDHYPVKSIKDIGGFFSGPWKQEVVPLWGEKVTLDHVEHGIVRPDFEEPRAHFALVCAAKGCPPLRSEAYVAERLNAQLEDQGKVFMATSLKNRVDQSAKVLFVSQIFKWFEEDFTAKSGTIEKFVQPYWPEDLQKATANGGFSVEYTEYDWTLNDAK